MASLQDTLCAGLLKMNYVETAARGNWRRFGKFRYFDTEGGGDAYYAMPDGTLWHSNLRCTEPDVEEKGKFLDNVFDAGVEALKIRQEWCYYCRRKVMVKCRSWEENSVCEEPPALNADQMLEELGK